MNPLFMQWLMSRQQGQKPIQQGLAGLMQGDVGLGRGQGQMLRPTNPGMPGMMTPGGQAPMSPQEQLLAMPGMAQGKRWNWRNPNYNGPDLGTGAVLDQALGQQQGGGMMGGGFTGGRENPRRMMMQRMGMK